MDAGAPISDGRTMCLPSQHHSLDSSGLHHNRNLVVPQAIIRRTCRGCYEALNRTEPPNWQPAGSVVTGSFWYGFPLGKIQLTAGCFPLSGQPTLGPFPAPIKRSGRLALTDHTAIVGNSASPEIRCLLWRQPCGGRSRVPRVVRYLLRLPSTK